MRWFWGLILVAAIAGAALMLRGGREGTSPTQPAVMDGASPPVRPRPVETDTASSAPREREPARSAEREPVPAGGEPVKPPAPIVPPTPAPPASPEKAGGAATTPPPETTPPPVEPSEKTGAQDSVKELIGPPKPTEEQLTQSMELALDDALGIRDPDTKPPEREPASDTAAKPATAVTGTTAKNGDTKPPADAKAKLVERPDGTVLVDDKYVIKGKGTQDDPFIVSWEMLVSAKDTYQPRLGRKVIPDRLKMIDGKWVKIAGFIAFPLAATSQDEMLMMLNQWDGCCIGIPPEPYDAIEVKLKVPVVGDDRMRVSGSVKGIIRVDPYLIKDWLVSLYLMDDAELFKDEKAAVRAPGMHTGRGNPGDSNPDGMEEMDGPK